MDGLNYNGLCGCQKALGETVCKQASTRCENNSVMYKGVCYKLYSQGPCSAGAWIVPKREGRQELWTESNRKEGVCECMPYFTKTVQVLSGKNSTECVPPSVTLANYLNRNYRAVTQNVTNVS